MDGFLEISTYLHLHTPIVCEHFTFLIFFLREAPTTELCFLMIHILLISCFKRFD